MQEQNAYNSTVVAAKHWLKILKLEYTSILKSTILN